MSLQSNQNQPHRSSGFGKRGHVTPPQRVQPQAQGGGNSNDTLKWVGGGVAAVAVLGLIGAGTGGGGLLGGLIGGMLGHKLAQGMSKAPATAAHAPAAHASGAHAPAAAATTVQRGGFGTTSSSSSFSSGS